MAPLSTAPGTPRERGGGADGNGVFAAGRARLEAIQCARLLAAMVEVAAERGFVEASVARVVAHAGVSRRTFYELLFDDREACFLAAFDQEIERASTHVLDAYDPRAPWSARVRAGLSALLEYLQVEPDAARLLVVASLGAGPGALERRQEVLKRLTALVDEGRMETKRGSKPPLLTAEGIVGGALSIVHTRLLASSSCAAVELRERSPRLLELVGPLMSTIVLPYLGATAARRELDRASPQAPARVPHASGDPLRELDMRLTYRTVRALMAVSANPGGSNRTVGEAAGLADQGQMSKLLTRLERLGLVENRRLAPGRGTPNAWWLTERGLAVQETIGTDS
jgi:AcrR family transcriptional regulator